jgi:PHD/YefM family antitoxin component YafN of YafNO toxin-antitoxin module
MAQSLESMDMREALRTVSAKEVASKFGYYTDEAMLHPVGIQRHGTTRVVMLSLKEYERLLRRDRQVLLVKDLDDETLDAIRNTEIPEESRRLDYLMDDPETD